VVFRAERYEMDFSQRRILGRTGLSVGCLGIASSYGAPTEAYEEAFERGVNYFYWGSMRKESMAQAIRNIIKKGRRDKLVIVIQSYSRSAVLLESFFRKGLRTLGIESADVLLLGWFNQRPSSRVMERVLSMKEKGMFRFLGLSGHNRSLFPRLAESSEFDLFHLRYNAAHRGAEEEVFLKLGFPNRPGLIAYTATRWGDLLNPRKMPPGEAPLRGADCYRFALTHPMVDVCIAGPKNIQQMREALRALNLGPLNDEEIIRVRRIGDYVHDHYKKLIFG
jgi:aryl-alcohol dehydrogenase-like predicted oxidoreductase